MQRQLLRKYILQKGRHTQKRHTKLQCTGFFNVRCARTTNFIFDDNISIYINISILPTKTSHTFFLSNLFLLFHYIVYCTANTQQRKVPRNELTKEHRPYVSKLFTCRNNRQQIQSYKLLKNFNSFCVYSQIFFQFNINADFFFIWFREFKLQQKKQKKKKLFVGNKNK